jgi:hypothetical protein
VREAFASIADTRDRPRLELQRITSHFGRLVAPQSSRRRVARIRELRLALGFARAIEPLELLALDQYLAADLQ